MPWLDVAAGPWHIEWSIQPRSPADGDSVWKRESGKLRRGTQMDESFVDDLHRAFWLLDLHGRSDYWFLDIARLLPPEANEEIVHRRACVGAATGAFSSETEALRQLFGLASPAPVPAESLAQCIADAVFAESQYDDDELGFTLVVSGLEEPLAEPASCAQLMSRSSLVHISYQAACEDASDLLAEVRAQGLLRARVPKDRFERENWELLERFCFVASPGPMRLMRWMLEGFEELLAASRVADRHPLVPTEYTLFIPPKRRSLVLDPIEHVIQESTRNPAAIRRLTPRDFERFLARIFEGFGYDVHITARTRDGGADLLCMTYSHGIPMKLAIEAKRYHPSRPISVDLVRSFVGANQRFRANKLIYVTTSRYTRDALKYATLPSLTELLELKELNDVVSWAREVSVSDFCLGRYRARLD